MHINRHIHYFDDCILMFLNLEASVHWNVVCLHSLTRNSCLLIDPRTAGCARRWIYLCEALVLPKGFVIPIVLRWIRGHCAFTRNKAAGSMITSDNNENTKVIPCFSYDANSLLYAITKTIPLDHFTNAFNTTIPVDIACTIHLPFARHLHI